MTEEQAQDTEAAAVILTQAEVKALELLSPLLTIGGTWSELEKLYGKGMAEQICIRLNRMYQKFANRI